MTDDGKQGPTPEEVADNTVSSDAPLWFEEDIPEPISYVGYQPLSFLTDEANEDRRQEFEAEMEQLRRRLNSSVHRKPSYTIYREPEIPKITRPRAGMNVRCKTAADGEYQALSKAVELFGDTDLAHYRVLETYHLFLSENTSDDDVWTGQMVVEYLGHAPQQEPGTMDC